MADTIKGEGLKNVKILIPERKDANEGSFILRRKESQFVDLIQNNTIKQMPEGC